MPLATKRLHPATTNRRRIALDGVPSIPAEIALQMQRDRPLRAEDEKQINDCIAAAKRDIKRRAGLETQ